MYLQPTYDLKRRCKHCGEPIADQVHAARKFCLRVVLEDGGILNCKDDYHSKKNKPLNAPFKFMTKCQKYYHSMIRDLFEKEGDMVTLELINRFGINLYRPFEFKITKERRYIFYFHEYAIEQLPDNKYKIIKHALF